MFPEISKPTRMVGDAQRFSSDGGSAALAPVAGVQEYAIPAARPEPAAGSAGNTAVLVLSNDQIAARDAAIAAQAAAALPQSVESALAGHIKGAFERAKTARQAAGIDEHLLSALRNRRGVYDAQKLAEIAEAGAPDIFVMLTDQKVSEAIAWLADVFGITEQTPLPATLEPTPIPDLPADAREKIVQHTLAAFQNDVQTGKIPAGVFAQGGDQAAQVFAMLQAYAKLLRDDTLRMMREEAEVRAKRMEQKIGDQFAESGWIDAFQDGLDDLCTMGTMLIEGPILRKQEKLVWRDGRATVEERVAIEFERFSPLDAYPAPDAVSPEEGDFVRRIRWGRGKIRALRGLPGVNNGAVDRLLANTAYSRGWKTIQPTDTERLRLADQQQNGQSSTIEGLKFWGCVSGRLLLDWGMDPAELDENEDYEVCALMFANEVVRVLFNYDPLGRRPVSKTVYERTNGSFWGRGVPHLMVDIQKAVNGAARALLHNMALASGSQIVCDMTQLHPAEDPTKVYPHKVWQVVRKPGLDGKPVESFKIDSNANELLIVLNDFLSKADARTRIPSYAFGNDKVAGAARTMGGLTILLNQASRSVKRILGNIDRDITRPSVERVFTFNMLFDPDDSIKGDVQIVVRGVLGLMVREQRQANLSAWLAQTANPVDMSIIGRERRRAALEAAADDMLELPTADLVPTKDQFEEQQRAEAEMGQVAAGPVGGGAMRGPQMQPAQGNIQRVPTRPGPASGMETT